MTERAGAGDWQQAICGICPAGCWVEVRVADGQLVDIRPDTGHPLGMICRRGQHAPEIVHSEHRLRYPMKRTGPKGTHEFERISWDEAYEIIVGRLQQIKRESGPEAVSIYTGRGAFELSLCDMFQPQGVAVSSASNVLFPFGSPNTMGVGALCYVSFAMIAPHVTMGRMLVNMFMDMESAELLVVWGANPATDSPPLDMARLEAAAKRGAQVVVIDPRRTETVTRTNAEWIAVRPGTDGALALSMLAVMIDEELYDETFADEWCHGFEELRGYVQHFSPEVAASITGVPADTIRSLARRICNATGACPVMYTGLEYSNSGIQAIRAVLTLFALAGQLDVPGGIGLAMRDTHFPINRACNQANPALDRAVARDRYPLYSHYRGESHASGLVTSVLEGAPYRIRALIVHGASLLTSWPQTPVWRETLSKLDFLVCVDRQLTADAAYADIVLPATTMFEIDSYMVYGPIFRLREKVVEPVGEARNDYLIMAELANRLGYGHLYPQTEQEMIGFALEGSGHTLEDIRAAGGWVKLPTPLMEYKKWEKGGLRPDGKPGFDTPTGKFEICSTILEEFGYEPLPAYTEPIEGPLARPDLVDRFPLVFNSGARPHTDFRSQHHGIDGLVRDNPEPTVTLNTRDAEKRDIQYGDLVEVRTPRGRVPFRAQVSDDIRPGAIECNMGGGTPVGPTAWQQWNVNELTDLENADEISGFPVYKALLCDVVKLQAGTGNGPRPAQQAATCGPVLLTPPAAPSRPRRRIYLDNNATTGVADEVREAMAPYLDAAMGNPSSIHGTGREAREAIETARRRVARLINARPRRIVFTGGGSEADNLALKGVAFAAGGGRHLITSAIEHPAVLESCRFLETVGFRVTYLEVDGDGLVSPAALRRALTPETVLVSVIMANNEVGTIQPIRDLCAIAHEHGALFHTDAVQAAGKLSIDVEELGVDLLTLSGHKFHGPKGVGVLYVKRGVKLSPLVHGGKQERGLRAGTENVPAIVGMGSAADLALQGLGAQESVRQLRDELQRRVQELVPNARLNGHPDRRLPNTLNLTLPGLRGESLVVALDQHGVSLSSGSACKSGSPEPTHVLIAMGVPAEDVHCSVRFSLSRRTTAQDIDATATALAQVLEEMETTVRFLPCK
ncbi:MAG: aminotransferase class V-fold PLP-dependent enzyme [Gemmatimonadota bacterium]|nr:aminotransferase class V-fold PLP-dependent enzyme [Gemmatimonadota bacterium]MDH3367969.1 aminotransferase class V-fold PLP-dependent enzyme [Gemmatimonadota bacterium]